MTIQSNLYVEKVVSEHPIAVWMLNDQLDFISLLTETNRQFYNASEWVLTGATGSLESSPPGAVPFPTSVTSKLTGSNAVSQIIALNASAFPTASLSTNLGNFAISGNLYVGSLYATSYSFGYQYTDTISGLIYYVETTKIIKSTDLNTWVNFSDTFDLPGAGATNVKMILRINVNSGGLVGDYNFYVNGFNLSQWSENFNSSSLGVPVSPISSSINLPTTLKTVSAACYGSTSKLGYYLSETNELYAKNFGIPLVFGSSNVTKLYPNVISGTTYPSVIFPGYGFLNEKGRHNEYTAEIWLSINTDTSTPKRIFGSIGSSDGLYIEGGFLTFVFNKQFKSHYVGEWFRPMLLHIRYVRDNVSILVNGEEVISISFVEADAVLPLEYSSGKSQDWLGFYAYAETPQFSIDSFAIYSYPVPNEVAKRRFIWGQGVTAPELENSSLNATTAFADYAYSNSSVNYNYPDFANWKQGFFNNVIPNSDTLELPNYKLPKFNFSSKTIQNWYDDLQVLESATAVKYFTFRPNVGWNSESCYISFDNFAVLNDSVESFYGIFQTAGVASNQTLFKITNKFSSDYVYANLYNTTLTYNAVISGTTTVLATKTITANQKFAAGINITNFGLQDIEGINSFFSNQNNLSISIAGTTTDTFTGNLYSFGFDSGYNNRKITSLYDSLGLFSETLISANLLYSHRSNYDLMPFEKYSIFFADISVSGYWEDYVPLSYFAKYIKDYEGDQNYDLDTIQFNVDYPEPIETSAIESISSWTYQDLYNAYSDPDVLSYEDLANNIFTGWDDYEDMSQASVKYYYYDTSAANIRTYVSFQKIVDGVNKNLVDFTNYEVARTKGTVKPNASITNWEDTVFELVDGTIIYPPKKYSDNSNVDFNDLGVVSHIDFFVNGIVNNPIKLRDLQFASQVYERTKFTEFGSKYGVPVYPYHKSGLYYDFKGENPISLYKDSTPHLFLTRHSGWRLRGDFAGGLDRGIAMIVNKEENIDLKISSLQVWLKYSENVFPFQEIKIISIAYKTDIIDVYLLGDSTTQRGKIYAKLRSTDAILENVEFHLDGILVETPYLMNGEWSCIGIAFPELVDFSSYTGSISLNGPLTYNNVSYAVATNLEQQQSIESRSWVATKALATGLGGWDYWQNSFTWQNVKVVSSTNIYSIDPSDIFNRYVGTNKVIIDDNVDGILVDPDQFKVYSDVVWSTTVATPV